jgi:protein gp37
VSTKIEWTDESWNPITGCTKVSPGCDHCYAETLYNRFNGPGAFDTVTLHPDRLTKPLSWRKLRKVFVNSMSDLFHKDVPDEYILDAWKVMARTPQHTYQILTKRHARMRAFVRRLAFAGPTREERAAGIAGRVPYLFASGDENQRMGAVHPLANVWLGVSVEDQQRADLRIPALLDTPAAVRFLSCEPLLGPVDLTSIRAVDWVICGGESGPGARPMHPEWARALRDQCQQAGVPFHFKQWGQFQPQFVQRYSELLAFSDPSRGCVIEPDARISAAWTMSGRDLRDDGVTPRGVPMLNVGKGRAGRVLDGRTWDEFPRGGAA